MTPLAIGITGFFFVITPLAFGWITLHEFPLTCAHMQGEASEKRSPYWPVNELLAALYGPPG